MKQRILAYGGAALGLLIIFCFFAYMPYRAKLHAADSGADDARRMLTEVEQFAAQLPAILAAQEALEQKRLDLDSKLYAKADVLQLLADIRKEAADHRVEVLEMSPPVEELLALNQNARQSDSPSFLNLQVTVSGPFVAMGTFVQSLEQSDYIRGINRCIITGARDGTEPLQMQLAFRALLGSSGGDA